MSIAELEAELRRARARRDEWEAEVAKENATVLALTKRLEIAKQHKDGLLGFPVVVDPTMPRDTVKLTDGVHAHRITGVML